MKIPIHTDYCFGALVNKDTRILILGSMPGKESLRLQQYYAHRRNSFWPIMLSYFSSSEVTDYHERCAVLLQHGVGLWDVIASCQRPTSLDADIITGSIVENSIAQLVVSHPPINAVFLNGQKAAHLFHRALFRQIHHIRPTLEVYSLPSTSPAHAALCYDAKRAAWFQALDQAMQKH